MRYVLQEWEIAVELPAGSLDEGRLAEVRTSFLETHRARYGFAREDRPIEFVTLSVKAVLPAPPIEYGASPRQSKGVDAIGRVQLLVTDPSSLAVEVPVYPREALPPGEIISGPLVVTEPTSTTYVQPGWRVHADEYGNLIARAA